MEQRYRCKQCNATFASGRVLGGHARGHDVARRKLQKRALSAAANEPETSDPSGSRGYGPRENPKKSWKTSHSRMRSQEHGPTGAPLDHVTVLLGPYPCRECGQVFESLKSLSNHRRVHVHAHVRQEMFKFNRGRRSDLEETLANVAPICPVRRKRSLRVFCAPPQTGESNRNEQPPVPSPVSETEQDDVHESALGLLLLSRGLRDPDDKFTEKIEILPVIQSGVSKKVDQTTKDDALGVKEISDSNYSKEVRSGDPNEEGKLVELNLQVNMVYLETECENAEGLIVFGDGETVMRARGDAVKLGCESEELEGCYGGLTKKPKLEHDWKGNKIKINKGSPDRRILSPTKEGQEKVQAESLLTKENEPQSERDSVNMDDKTYRCPTCYKVYGSCHALRGHKRVHSVKASTGTKAGRITKVLNQFWLSDIPDLLDLNAQAMCT
ncbi:uncharacterized protein LOC116214460 [Punica granatum]|uniref:C2H2-type domain-containing protein n=2 Tax=Punica granatum TaxID=22663 RepID=A0A218WPM7_PUNGR|nr:uncharacterized protein LOC116214460 [Punica granatum]OWM74794.1 hypothetical protein CDL15_Pgr004561 [Punica granatum]PKI38752.1 hypothetical protein CRG98_040865 [Punica granatum]